MNVIPSINCLCNNIANDLLNRLHFLVIVNSYTVVMEYYSKQGCNGNSLSIITR